MCCCVQVNVDPCANVLLWLCSCKEMDLLCDRKLLGGKVQCVKTLVYISAASL